MYDGFIPNEGKIYPRSRWHDNQRWVCTQKTRWFVKSQMLENKNYLANAPSRHEALRCSVEG